MGDYYNLGNYSRSISTTSPEAQTWFDRGLVWNYAYHHEEAVECFRKALEYDPACVMAYWGIAYAIGPNYNKQWGDFDDDEKETCLADAHLAVANAINHLDKASAIEKGLIEALDERYPQRGGCPHLLRGAPRGRKRHASQWLQPENLVIMSATV